MEGNQHRRRDRRQTVLETYWMRVKTAFDERKFIDPYFQPIHMDRGSKAMRNHWGVIQAA
jgi:hypothetical protein